ncbi:MAG: iron-sulfur cluster assembly scaffold protein [Clostridiales bacterium]|nr:iron-sulfur cluster assembly scaffold protein [Clostridiales bacterium]
MYSKVVMDRFQNPRNAGGMHGANAIGQVGNAACGDIMKMYLKINDNGIIENARFKTFGCCAAIASTDIACDLIKGKSIEDALKVTNKDVIDKLGELPTHKLHCSLMAEDSIRAAIEDFYKRKEKESKQAIKKSKRNEE